MIYFYLSLLGIVAIYCIYLTVKPNPAEHIKAYMDSIPKNNLWDYVVWVFYFLLTVKERDYYNTGLNRGYQVEKIDDDMFGRTVTYSNKPPQRNYLNFDEFMERRRKNREWEKSNENQE